MEAVVTDVVTVRSKSPDALAKRYEGAVEHTRRGLQGAGFDNLEVHRGDIQREESEIREAYEAELRRD